MLNPEEAGEWVIVGWADDPNPPNIPGSEGHPYEGIWFKIKNTKTGKQAYAYGTLLGVFAAMAGQKPNIGAGIGGEYPDISVIASNPNIRYIYHIKGVPVGEFVKPVDPEDVGKLIAFETYKKSSEELDRLVGILERTNDGRNIYFRINGPGRDDRGNHSGIDVSTENSGDLPVRAVHDGVIGWVFRSEGTCRGLVRLDLDGPDGVYVNGKPVSVTINHLDPYRLPEVGKRVKAGDIIGYSNGDPSCDPDSVAPHFEMKTNTYDPSTGRWREITTKENWRKIWHAMEWLGGEPDWDKIGKAEGSRPSYKVARAKVVVDRYGFAKVNDKLYFFGPEYAGQSVQIGPYEREGPSYERRNGKARPSYRKLRKQAKIRENRRAISMKATAFNGRA
ncbi:MAG: M23 family metallopeptidase [Chloroflexi bacterium]|nr:M23 family metallopeptidase [Chloroflexota bacterium]